MTLSAAEVLGVVPHLYHVGNPWQGQDSGSGTIKTV